LEPCDTEIVTRNRAKKRPKKNGLVPKEKWATAHFAKSDRGAKYSTRGPDRAGLPCLVRLGPDGGFGAGLAAMDAGFAGLLGLQRKQPDRRFGFCFDLGFALGVAAPGPSQEPAAGRKYLLELGVILRRERVGFTERQRVLEEVGLDLLEQLVDCL